VLGYPTFTPTGIEVSCELNAAILFGAIVKVMSIVPMLGHAAGDALELRTGDFHI
jgi:hypothetical protein